MRLDLLLVMGFVVVAAAVGADVCNKTCHNNNECRYNETPANATNLCTHCVAGRCTEGLGCGANCSVDTDCNQLGQCHLCTGRICSSTGLCGAYCDDDKQKCQGDCTACQRNVCVAGCNAPCRNPLRTGKSATNQGCVDACPLCLQNGLCGADHCCTNTYCNANCTSDAGCGGDCAVCSPTLHRCVKQGCGSECALDTDCTHTGGLCKLCLLGKCTSECGGECASTSDCNADCQVCNNGRCVPGGCSALCLTNAGCDPLGDCTYCAPTTPTQKKCIKGLPCGGDCTNDMDCDQKGSCRVCPLEANANSGKCVSQ